MSTWLSYQWGSMHLQQSMNLSATCADQTSLDNSRHVTSIFMGLYTSLLDTGAEVNIICREAKDRLGWIMIWIGSSPCAASIFVFNKCPYDMILGQLFFQDHMCAMANNGTQLMMLV